MEMTIPLMTVEMLKFPKLCYQYFDLLSHLCEMYPETVSGLPLPYLRTLMSTIDCGLRQPETRVLRIVMESLESLAKHQWHCMKTTGVTPILDDVIQGAEPFDVTGA